MSSNFNAFTAAVRKRFADMTDGGDTLFVVDSDRDAIWARYLSAFPPGTDPTFVKRTEHDCSCCRHFIRDVGNVVAIQNGAVSTVWDLSGLPEPYQTVANAMAEHVRSLKIRNLFLVKAARCGVEYNTTLVGGETHRFTHFSVVVPKKFVSDKIDELRGDARTATEVLKRGLEELTPDALSQVADLIDGDSIYRGAEFKGALSEFTNLHSRYAATPDSARDAMLWALSGSRAARFRNTVIGTLVQDLSDGVELEAAVRSYESKVAPSNYKRPKSLITKGMVDAAMKTIDSLGLETALHRRHAKISDVSVSDVLFVDNSVRGDMKGGVKDLLMKEVKAEPFDARKPTEIGIDDFVSKVIPKATRIDLFLENSIAGHMVNVTAPVHDDTKRLFKWNNDFAWSYDGNVADSIKDKVKRAGGKVEGVALRVSLNWHNLDDLDLHAVDPTGTHVYFGNKCDVLDVDMNVTTPRRDAVENMRWTRLSPRNGVYRISVDNYSRRESVDTGFTVEVESELGLTTLSAPAAGRHMHVCDIEVSNGKVKGVTPSGGVTVGEIKRDAWGLKTGSTARVNAIVLSPNYWGSNAVGNKHTFFILDGCANPNPTRGMYNEFLNSDLEKHRKVFEVLGDKMKCPPAGEQFAGVGFSSTKRDRVTVRAIGPKLNSVYTIAF